MRYIPFLKWWLLITLIIVGGYFAHEFKVFHQTWDKDFTKLSFVIFAGFIGASIQCGSKTLRLSRAVNKDYQFKIKEIKREQEIGWFMSDIFVSLGLVGTVIGMIFALHGFVGVDVGTAAATQQLISKLVLGVSTALFTTLAGLICSILLKMQYFNLSTTIEKYIK